MEVVNMLKRKEFNLTETFAYRAEKDLEKSIIDSFFNKSIDEIDFDFSETENIGAYAFAYTPIKKANFTLLKTI